MEKVTVKIELEREDISTLMFLAGGKLSEEQWNKLKGTEYTVEDDDLEGQAIQLKLAISGIVVGNLLKKELSEGEVSSKSTYREKLIAMRKEMEERGQSWSGIFVLDVGKINTMLWKSREMVDTLVLKEENVIQRRMP